MRRWTLAAGVALVAAASCEQAPTTPQNSAPTVTVAFQGASTCAPRPGASCSLDVVAQATDPDGDALQYVWSGCASGTGARAACAVSVTGPVTASVAISDGHGHNVVATATGAGVDAPNGPPVVSVVFEGASTCEREGSRACSLTVIAQATDPDGDPLTYAWSGCASGTSARAACTVASNGPVVATVEVRDDHGHAVGASATGEGRENLPPIVTVAFQGASACTPQIGRPCTLDVVATATDPDGDALRYSWSGCASGTSSRAACTVQRPGAIVASVEVSDARGHVVRAESAGSGAGTNRPPGVQIGYVTLLLNSSTWNVLGNVMDPDEGFLCGSQYCATPPSASGACRVTWYSCTCLGGIEADVPRTSPTGICTLTFLVKDSWGEEGRPTFTFDVSTGRPTAGSTAASRPGGQR